MFSFSLCLLTLLAEFENHDTESEFKTTKENAMGICVYQYLRFARESNELLWEGEVIKVIFKELVDCDISMFMVLAYFSVEMQR